MSDNGIGDYFISDVEDDLVDDEDVGVGVPLVVPSGAPAPQQVPAAASPAPAQPAPAPSAPAGVAPPAPQAPPAAPSAASAPPNAPVQPIGQQAPAAVSGAPARPQTAVRPPTREEQLASTLDGLIENSPDIQAAALVSMDGFTMAAALPEGMHEDRVGAMSAAILGLGERAAAELGRGHLSQVFIEGQDGYVLLMAAGGRAVLTVLASRDSKLGLIIYDMRNAAEAVGTILG